MNGYVPNAIQTIQSDFAPQIAPSGNITPVPLRQDPDGNLLVRSTSLTDEGSIRANFANTSIAVSVGTITLTNNSNVLTGTNFAQYDLHVGDHVKLDADSESAWAQIDYFETASRAILVSNYTGTGGTSAGSRAYFRPTTGSGGSISVASGQLTIASGGTSAAITGVERVIDNSPLIFRSRVSISQRVANQQIRMGLKDPSATVKYFSRFVASGTTNTVIDCVTARNPTTTPSGSETQTTTVTLPRGVTTAVLNDYRIEQLVEVCRFFINGVLVASHFNVLPQQYDELEAHIEVENTGAASNTNIVVDYIVVKNHNKQEVAILSEADSIVANQPTLEIANFTQTGVIAINTDIQIIDCRQLRSVNVQITSIGTTGRIDFFLTNDLSVVGTAILAYPIGGAAAVITTLAAGMWNISTNGGGYLRVRMGVATTAGTTTVFITGSQMPVPISAPTTQSVSGTVAVTSTTLSGGQTAHSTAATGNPLRTGGKVQPTTIAAQDTTLVTNDTSDTFVSSSGQAIIKPFGTSELDYYHAVLPVVTTTTPQSIVAAAGTALIRNYITQLTVQTDTLGVAGNMFILDNQGAIGTSVTIATPGVFTSTAHDLRIGDCIIFTAIGTITGISINTMYFVTAANLATTTFSIALTPGGTAIQITGATSAFTFYRVFYMFRLNTAALATPVTIMPVNPYKGIANSNLNVYFPASLLTGVVYLNINGYRGF